MTNYPQGLDLVALTGDADAVFQWMKTLIRTGEGELSMLPNSAQEEVLWSLFWGQHADRRTKGQQVLYVTYPQLITDAEAVQPLLRWPCGLVPPSPTHRDWLLQIRTTQPAQWNVHWAADAELTYPHPWGERLAACLQGGDAALEAIRTLVLDMLEKTPWQSSVEQAAIANAARPDAAGQTLWWSAALAFSQTSWMAAPRLSDTWQVPLPADAPVVSDTLLARLSPSQYRALQTAAQQRYSWLERSASQQDGAFTPELIKWHLHKGKTCLVVSREKGVLERLQAHLDAAGLGDLHQLWQDEAANMPVFKAVVAAWEKNAPVVPDYDSMQWRTELTRQNRNQRQLDDWFAASRIPVFADKGWSELLGDYLYFSKKEGKESLASQLQVTQYRFTREEYDEVVAALAHTKPLFEQLGSVYHPLGNLSAAIFIHQDEDSSREFIQTTTDRLLAAAHKLHQRFVRVQGRYADQLSAYHESYYLQLRNALDALDAHIEDGQNSFGADTLQSGDLTLKLYGRFSDKFAQARLQKEKITAAFDALRALHEQRGIFAWEWPALKSANLLDTLTEQGRTYRGKLEMWRNSLSDTIHNEIIRLNHKTALPELATSAGIESIEQDLEVFVDEVNACGLYQLPLQANTLTLARQQKHLEEIIEQLERTRDGLLQQYSLFHQWQRNWFSMSENTRKTIQALLRARPQDWTAAFSSWYFNECLQQHYSPFPAMSRKAKEMFADEAQALRAAWPKVLLKDWDTQRRQANAALKSGLRQAADTLSGVMEQYGAAMATFKPVALATPEMAASLSAHYDVILYEQAQCLTTSDVAPSLAEARHVIVLSDEGQRALRPDGWLLTLSDSDMTREHLDDDPVLPLASYWQQRGAEVYFYQVDGRYDAVQHINDVEVQEVVKWLNTIEKMPNQTYPRVGVITWSRQQRDRIQQYLYRIKRDRSPGAELVQQLERNGLQIVTGGDALGQSFDVILVSPILGVVDAKGHLPANIHTLNEAASIAKQYSLLSVLRQAKVLHVLNSMPTDELAVRLDWEDRPGEQLWARWLLSAHAFASQDAARLTQLAESHRVSPRELPTDYTLHQELIQRLEGHLTGWQWRVGAVEDLAGSYLVAQAPDSGLVVIVPDDFLSEQMATTIEWEATLQERLAGWGYQWIGFSSEHLWKDPARTCHRLAAELEGLRVAGAVQAMEEEE